MSEIQVGGVILLIIFGVGLEMAWFIRCIIAADTTYNASTKPLKRFAAFHIVVGLLMVIFG